ncbi:carboxymuconolactone decarboxylase family protein [Flexibacterium corallicola]|uniref:carboxymuconolactone decarboxylase family protein n=1 Tax=Flexibacterium corallicola TaxID=3037259 RepID=UPI00286F222C|nr:carboxymuconolactone decarboxylase family protein [Pseudovibrio sp. M1P-2-3]
MNLHESTIAAPIVYEEHTPDLFQKLYAVHMGIVARDFEPKLRHLLTLRASQINGCAYCVNMHLEEARSDGETQDRLDKLVVWSHVDLFSSAERAALAWTEALTVLDPKEDMSKLRAELLKHFTAEQISILTTTIAMINLWNRLQVSKH